MSNPLDMVSVRLADEGVPLRAIARATNTPSEQLRSKLHAALLEGLLLDLPREDWPPGFPRDQRALQLTRMVIENREAVQLAMQQLFGLTATEATLLMSLLSNQNVSKERIDMADNCFKVHIFNIRSRLEAHDIAIDTLWGYGYQLSPAGRHRLMDMVMARIREPVA
jgi:DNA-binding response OmpR family regulator